jgi:hypothetical protein
MAKFLKSILIEAPAEKIFNYLNDPNNLTEIWPSIVDVKDVKIEANGGASFKFGYKMAGVRLEAFSEDTEFVPNQRTVSRTSGGMEGWTRFSYEPIGSGTNVTLEIEYKVPLPVIGRLAEAIIIKLNEQEGLTLLANLKTRMEG